MDDDELAESIARRERAEKEALNAPAPVAKTKGKGKAKAAARPAAASISAFGASKDADEDDFFGGSKPAAAQDDDDDDAPPAGAWSCSTACRSYRALLTHRLPVLQSRHLPRRSASRRPKACRRRRNTSTWRRSEASLHAIAPRSSLPRGLTNCCTTYRTQTLHSLTLYTSCMFPLLMTISSPSRVYAVIQKTGRDGKIEL